MSYPADFEPGPNPDDLPVDVKRAIFSPRPEIFHERIEELRPNRLAAIFGALVLVIAIFSTAANFNVIECWACDRLDWLPRDCALHKLKMSRLSHGAVLLRVTGIAVVNDHERIAEYEWNLAQPDVSSGTYKQSQPSETYYGSASFRLFDDGWRVQE